MSYRFTVWSLTVCLVISAASGAQEMPKLPPVDLSTMSPADFADEELDLPYYLHHLPTIANSMLESGENRGFAGSVG